MGKQRGPTTTAAAWPSWKCATWSCATTSPGATPTHGIMLRTIQDSVIENNVVAGNGRGFFIYDAEYNVDPKQHRQSAIDVGVHVSGRFDATTRSRQRLHRQRGTGQIRRRARRCHGAANYWSNYVGWDRNGDGVGDVPYEANDVVDRLQVAVPDGQAAASAARRCRRCVSWRASSRCCARPASSTRHPRMRPLNRQLETSGVASPPIEVTSVTKRFGDVLRRDGLRPVASQAAKCSA